MSERMRTWRDRVIEEQFLRRCRERDRECVRELERLYGKDYMLLCNVPSPEHMRLVDLPEEVWWRCLRDQKTRTRRLPGIGIASEATRRATTTNTGTLSVEK